MSAQAIDAALLCEYSQRANGGAPEAAANMVEARALACDDPLTRGVLLLEVARLREQRSDVGGALDALRRAALDLPLDQRRIEHPAHVLDRHFGLHRTKRDDLRHRVATIHFCNVVNNLVTFIHTEIDVEIGHRNTFWVQETFEQQLHLNRVDGGDAERITHRAIGG